MIPKDPEAREAYRKRRLAHYYATAREIWGREEGDARLHVFAMATFGGDVMVVDEETGKRRPSIAKVPLDEWMDEEMDLWLRRCKTAMMRRRHATSSNAAQVDGRTSRQSVADRNPRKN